MKCPECGKILKSDSCSCGYKKSVSVVAFKKTPCKLCDSTGLVLCVQDLYQNEKGFELYRYSGAFRCNCANAERINAYDAANNRVVAVWGHKWTLRGWMTRDDYLSRRISKPRNDSQDEKKVVIPDMTPAVQDFVESELPF